MALASIRRARLIGVLAIVSSSAVLGPAAPGTHAQTRGAIDLGPRSAEPAVVSNVHGDAVAAWSVEQRGKVLLRTTSRSAGESWSPIRTLVSRPARRSDNDVVPRIESLEIDGRGAAHLLWATYTRDPEGDFDDAFSPTGIFVSSSTRGGRWDRPHVLARSTPATELGFSEGFGVRRDGLVVAAWTTTPVDSAGEDEASSTVFTQERSTDGTWSARRSAGPYGGYFGPRVAFDPAGKASMVWSLGGREYPDSGPIVMSTRTTTDVWTAPNRMTTLETGPYGTLGPLIGRDGAANYLELREGSYGIGSLVHRRVTSAGTTKTTVPIATAQRRLKGRLGGSWYVESPTMALDAKGRVIVAFRSPGPDVEEGGRGIGSLWAATRAPSGRWSVAAVDALGEGTDNDRLALGSDGAGQIVATWRASSRAHGGCQFLLFRADRLPSGRWSRRSLIGEGKARDGRCAGSQVSATDGRAPLMVVSNGGRSLLTPLVASTPTSSASFATTDITTTWATVRRAGGLLVPCRSAIAGHCSVSSVRAAILSAGDGAADQLRPTLGCFPFRVTAPSDSGAVGYVRLRFSGHDAQNDCRDPLDTTFSALVTFDAVGYLTASRRIKVTIRR